MPIDIQSLPAKIKESPHWRVRFLPGEYKPKRIGTLPSELFDIIKQTQVNLRGWPYPFLSENRDGQIRSDNYIASGVSWSGHEECWRLYYSGQFIHIFSIREKAMPEWDEQLRESAQYCIHRRADDDLLDIPGFINIINLLYHFTEVFEFASRLCNKRLSDCNLQVIIELNGIKGFSLMAGPERFWHGYYPATSDTITKTWDTNSEMIIAKSSEMALEGCVSFLNMFGWDDPSIDTFKEDQKKFLSGRY